MLEKRTKRADFMLEKRTKIVIFMLEKRTKSIIFAKNIIIFRKKNIMAHTFSKLYFQIVFAVKNRDYLIEEEWKDNLYNYIWGIIKNNNAHLFAIGGIENHIHILIGCKQTLYIPDLVNDIKRCSTNWINNNHFSENHFAWQEGYGVFSYSQEAISNLKFYIKNQIEHHKTIDFKDEYLSMISDENGNYDECDLLEDVK